MNLLTMSEIGQVSGGWTANYVGYALGAATGICGLVGGTNSGFVLAAFGVSTGTIVAGVAAGTIVAYGIGYAVGYGVSSAVEYAYS
ncbi:hypothetical protein [Shewanella surugensis]|uniref:Bacteriocin n=1 Tax=Shewanella surugensis TaxID=212020 RepID=A0ABT0L6S0_9GAMM|nr:hypothetical protein [Shewanella surugensis]MCL1123383.1 hypothetical protein [Shewanella surugensis]